MKSALLIVGCLFFIGCNQNSAVSLSSIMATDFIGDWVYASKDCQFADITINEDYISDSEIVCKIKDQSLSSDGVMTFFGEECQAEGYKLADFNFKFRANANNKLEYRNSGEGIWYEVMQCSPN